MTEADIVQYVLFSVEGVRYGIEIALVREIVPRRGVVRVPRALRSMEGMMDLRGRTLPVLSMREILGVGGDGSRAGHVIVAEVGEAVLGLSVDSAHAVARIAVDRISADPIGVPGLKPQYVAGTLVEPEGITVLLDVAQAFRPGELELLEAGMADVD